MENYRKAHRKIANLWKKELYIIGITETYGKLIMKNYGNTQRTTGNSEKLWQHMGNYRL